MSDAAPVTVQITPEDLAITWQTLMAVARNYDIGTESQACLIEARRLVEVEVRLQHGDDAWQKMLDGSLTEETPNA